MSNKNLKIAFCYSGFMRNFKQNFIKNKDLIKKLNPDIFIYTYDSFGYKNDSSIPEPKNKKNIDINYFSNIPNIKKLIIENFNEKKIEQLEDKDMTYYMHDHHAYPKNILSQLYSIKKCNDLKKEYEKNNNFKYDLVFRVRPDSYFEYFDIRSLHNFYDKNKQIFVGNEPGKYWGSYCNLCSKNEQHLYHQNDISDIFAFGTSESMNYYSSLFLVANKIHKDLLKYNEEVFLNSKENIKEIDNKKIINFNILNTSQNTNKDTYGNECYLFYPESLLRFYLNNYKVLNYNLKIKINRNEIY